MCTHTHVQTEKSARERYQALPHETPESNPSQKERKRRRRKEEGIRRQETEQKSATDKRRTAALVCGQRAAQGEINRQRHLYIQDRVDSWKNR